MMQGLAIDIELVRDDFRLAIAESLDVTGITAIFGANGSGKTSLLRVIAGLEPSARGTVSFRGNEWLGPGGNRRPESRAIGYVFQDGRLFSHLDVESNLRFPEKYGRRSGPIELADVVTWLRLDELLHRQAATLSGGERQRVAIARALLASPELLLMDEPLSSLDHPSRLELLPLIKALPDRFGMPIVLVTHDLDELVYLADTVVLIANGRQVARGSAREILDRGDFEQLTDLGEPGAVLEAQIVAQTEGLTIASVASSELRIPRVAGTAGEIIRLRVQPRDVILALEPLTGISIRNCLPATVRGFEHAADGQVVVVLALGSQSIKARITQDAAAELGLGEGMRVHALIKTVALDAFT